MRYRVIAQLPDDVRYELPLHAQEVYKDTFNRAWEDYERAWGKQGHPDRQAAEFQEEIAHMTAWANVKRLYLKIGDRWVKK